GGRRGVIGLDDEDLRMASEDGAQVAGTRCIERGAGRILRARRQDEGVDARAERAREVVGTRARVVDRDRLRDEPERGDEVEDGEIARILDGNAVAGAEMRLQYALDAVERAADDGELPGREAVVPQLARG